MVTKKNALAWLLGVVVSENVIAYFVPGTPTWYPLYQGGHRAQLLDGVWSYGFDESLADALNADAFAVETSNMSLVPSTVDAAPPGYFGKRGASYYARTVNLSANESYSIEFMGCAFYCKVWLDGNFLGDNLAGGYAPWSVRLSSGLSGNKSLIVLADNRFNDTTAPLHTGGDFWHYGGLVRSVVLHSWPSGEASISRALFFPYRDESEGWYVDINVSLTEPLDTVATVYVDWDSLTSYEVVFEAGYGVIAAIEAPASAPVWSLDDPQLIVVGVFTQSGGVSERFGLRAWGTDKLGNATRLTLNGQVIKLHGWNHHTQWPHTGMSPTESQLDEDTGLLTRAATNYVRGAHYPQDQRWLDRLDELGIAMWEEALGPDVDTSNIQDPYFMKAQIEQIDQMVNASANHPSIFVFGFFNEGPSKEEDACVGYQACANRIQALDSTRFITWASNKQQKDVCLDAATLVSFNNYPAWYTTADPTESWNSDASWVNSNFPDKPFVISETGAGGIYEWDNATAVRWSLKYQTEVIVQDVQVALQNPIISGITLWHFFDFKGNDDAQAYGACDYLPGFYPPVCAYINSTQTRPGGENHKGVVDFWRRPKPSFDAVAALYRNWSSSP